VLFLFFLTGKGATLLTVEQKTPTWFNALLKNQIVSKEVLLLFKKHYLTSNKEERENEKL
jgi:hypothetical protein